MTNQRASFVELSPITIDTIRAIASRLLDQRPRSVLYFCSFTPTEGTTSLVLSLARTLGQDGLRVLLVDANVINSRLSRLLRQFVEADDDAAAKPDADIGRPQSTSLRNLAFVTCHAQKPSPRPLAPLARFLSTPPNEIDIVLIDGCSLRQLSDLAVLRDLVDGVVLVVESEKHSPDTLATMKRRLECSGVPLIGAILNRKKQRIPHFIYKRL